MGALGGVPSALRAYAQPIGDVTPEDPLQVDAMFAPLYALIPTRHHRAIVRVERDMINALKAALQNGTLSKARIDQAATRIIALKMEYHLMPATMPQE